MISDKLKKIIFDELYRELGKAEIINYNGNVWFIDREKKYWYFELQKDGRLWWRYSFFNNFFLLFSLDSARFEPILKDWVEEVLNCKVDIPFHNYSVSSSMVEEVLNCKVNTTVPTNSGEVSIVEEVLNHKVDTTYKLSFTNFSIVEEVLNHKVDTTQKGLFNFTTYVDKVLNHKVTNMDGGEMIDEESYVDKVLNHTIK